MKLLGFVLEAYKRGVLLRAVSFVLLLLAISGSARATEIVQFESAAIPHSPFKMRQAKAKGLELEAVRGALISGRLSVPGGEGPFPAIVLMHGCAGVGEWNDMWSRRLNEWGYITLDVDSLTPRGENSICNSPARVSAGMRALDAYGAKQYLKTLATVEPSRVALMGMSHGGWTALSVVSKTANADVDPFQAIVAYYPYCSPVSELNAPLLVLTGEEDDWSPVSLCRNNLAEVTGDIKPELHIYPGVHHLFDVEGTDSTHMDHVLRYNAEAAADAEEKTRNFFELYLR